MKPFGYKYNETFWLRNVFYYLPERIYIRLLSAE